METIIPRLLYHLQTSRTAVYGVNNTLAVAEAGLKAWQPVHDHMKNGHRYIWDSGEYERGQQATEEERQWYRETFGREHAPRYRDDGEQIKQTAIDMAAMNLLHLPHRQIVIEDYSSSTPEFRYVILAEEEDFEGWPIITFAFFVVGCREDDFRPLWMPYQMTMLPRVHTYNFVVVPHRMWEHSPMALQMLASSYWQEPVYTEMINQVGFCLRKLIVMLASKGVIVERQTPVLTGREPKALRRLHRSYNTIRLPFVYEVNKDGERVEADGPKINRRAHWVRGHVRGRNCWPQHKWTWVRPHFRGTGELYEPLFTEVVGTLH